MTLVTVSSPNKKTVDLDSIFIEIGDFGLFQIYIYALITMPVLLVSWYSFEYIFTAGHLDYRYLCHLLKLNCGPVRCKVAECDFPPVDDYLPNWTRFAIPYSHNVPSKCLRYESIQNDSHFKRKLNNCDEMFFNDSYSVVCTEFIYKTDEVTILKEFNLTCEENEWKLAFIGTVKNIAELLILPFFGILSDRYGRRKMLIYSLAGSGIFGFVMAFSTRYWAFVLLEIITGMFSSGIYNVIFVFGMEMVTPKKRVLGGCLIAMLYSTGQILLGVIAMNTLHFRKLLLILYVPTYVVLAYIWIIPESVRWLLSKGRRHDATVIIYRAARMNKKILTAATIECLYYAPTNEEVDEVDKQNENHHENTFVQAIQSRPVFKRLIQCCFCWFSTALVYYGLSVQSVNLHGNKFINFTMFSLAEYPPILMVYFLLDKVGRKRFLCGSLLVSGIACATPVLFIPDSTNVWRILLFGLGKCAITMAFTILFVYSTELFPTNLRQSAMSLCAVFSCIGAMAAPQTSLLMKYWSSLPFAVFSGFTITSGILIMQLPETSNRKLPDTIKEL